MLWSLTVIRHGKSTPLPKGASHDADLGRLLTPEGFVEVQVRRKKMLVPQYDLVLTSPATRAVMTALIFTSGSQVVVPLDELCYEGPEGPEGKLMWPVFNKLGHTTFGAYSKAEGTGAFEVRGRRAWAKVLEQRKAANAMNVLIASHHPFINGLGRASTEHSDKWRTIFEDTFFHEAQGYTLAVRDNDVFDVRLHQD